MAITPTVEGFSLSHAAILDGSTGLAEVDGDVYGIRSGSLEVDTGSYDNTGDDSVLSSWNWFNFATVTVQAGYIPFKLVSLLTGDTITSTGVGDAIEYSLPLWSEPSLNTPTRPMLISVPSKDKDGNVRKLDFVLYKVQFQPISFDGPTYKDGLLANYSGKALMADVDEEGSALTDRAIGRMISGPVT